MKLKASTWILIATLAALAAYLFLVDERNRVRDAAERDMGARLFPHGPDEVVRFVLINAKGERLEAEREASGWKIVRPIETGGAIASFVEEIVPGRKSTEITNVPAYADYGLDEPFATLIIQFTGQAGPDTLYVGDETPTGSNCYLRLSGSRNVYVASRIMRDLTSKGIFDFREKRLFPEDFGDIREMEIRAGPKRIWFTRENERWWIMPERTRANGSKIERYLTRLTGALIHEFAREDTRELDPFGLDHPAGELVMRAGAETVAVAFGNEKEYLIYVARTGLDKVVAIETSLREPLGWTADDMRALNLAFIDEEAARSLRYETPDTVFVIERTEGSWRTPEREIPAERRHAVAALMHKMNSTLFERILKTPLPIDGRFESYALRVTIADAGGSVIDQIVVVSRPDGSEIGYSKSANALGSLPRGTAAGIDALMKRIGQP